MGAGPRRAGARGSRRQARVLEERGGIPAGDGAPVLAGSLAAVPSGWPRKRRPRSRASGTDRRQCARLRRGNRRETSPRRTAGPLRRGGCASSSGAPCARGPKKVASATARSLANSARETKRPKAAHALSLSALVYVPSTAALGAPQHLLNFRPLPRGHGALRPIPLIRATLASDGLGRRDGR